MSVLDSSFLPQLAPSDVEHAAQLIRQAQAPPTPQTTPDDLKRLQQELFEMQRRPEAWGLIIPFLESQDPTIQFFGAHTAQVKIARDWETFPDEHVERLRDLMLQVTALSIMTGRAKFIIRKLFVALTSIALKLVPGNKDRWPNWILACVTTLSGRGASPEYIHDFLVIASEEIVNADLIGPARGRMNSSLNDAIPLVIQSIKQTIDRPPQSRAPAEEIDAGLQCFQAWLSQIPSNDLTDIIPILIALLDPSSESDTVFISASDTLQEVMQRSALSDGSGSKTLTEPLMVWLEIKGSQIIHSSVSSGDPGSPVSHSICKLLTALGDHSSMYIANNISSTLTVSLPPSFNQQLPIMTAPPTKGHLVQTFLRLMLVYTGLSGYYGIDEEESEMTLPFWFLLQESLWTTDFYFPEDDNEEKERQGLTQSVDDAEELKMAKAVYTELVQVLRRKVAFPPEGGWPKDQVQSFEVYRRDVGDTLINSYYVLRDDMVEYFVNDILSRLASNQLEWHEVEATLHCLMSIQESLDPNNENPQLARLFSQDIMGRIPTSGVTRLRRTMVNTIGTYASWFAIQPPSGPGTYDVLMNAVGYVVNALVDQALCLQAANALRQLCDYNKKALAPQLDSFGALYSAIGNIPDSEKPKVLQSIASVVQALPPEGQVGPVNTITQPITHKLAELLQSGSTLPDEARALVIVQLEALTGISKGLTRTSDPILALDDTDSSTAAEIERINQVRQDSSAQTLRNDIFLAIRGSLELWSTDSLISAALIDLIKAITALPSDTTILTLQPGPLMEVICSAMQRQVTAAWLTVSSMIIAQLNPPTFSMTKKTGPSPEAQAVLDNALPVILQASLNFLAQPGVMAANPDVVQEFMSCMNRVAQDFTHAFYNLPDGALDALMNCSITCLSLQERYSLVGACNFLGTLIHRSSVHEDLVPKRDQLMQAHGYALTRTILHGVAGGTPPSVLPHLNEMMSALTTRLMGDTRKWVSAALFAEDFPQTKATPEDKQKLAKSLAGAKNMKRIREAMNNFSIVSRGLNNSNFGISSISAM